MPSKRPTKKKGPPPAPPLDAQVEENAMDLNVKDQDEFDNLWVVKALKMVHGSKEEEHGHPHNTFTLVRAGWSIISGTPLTFTQVCYMMVWHKMARELITGGHPEEDNNIDSIGYLAVLNRIKLEDIRQALEEDKK
jgi:hypothetical protein